MNRQTFIAYNLDGWHNTRQSSQDEYKHVGSGWDAFVQACSLCMTAADWQGEQRCRMHASYACRPDGPSCMMGTHLATQRHSKAFGRRQR